MSSVDSAFGLTEEQRLAKEEEERNVALVEIQLRDEHSFPALGVSLKYTVNVVRKTVCTFMMCPHWMWKHLWLLQRSHTSYIRQDDNKTGSYPRTLMKTVIYLCMLKYMCVGAEEESQVDNNLYKI